MSERQKHVWMQALMQATGDERARLRALFVALYPQATDMVSVMSCPTCSFVAHRQAPKGYVWRTAIEPCPRDGTTLIVQPSVPANLEECQVWHQTGGAA